MHTLLPWAGKIGAKAGFKIGPCGYVNGVAHHDQGWLLSQSSRESTLTNSVGIE